VPGGVVNVLTGLKPELVPVLAGHADVDALDTWGVPDTMRMEIDVLAADDVKRVLRRPTTGVRGSLSTGWMTAPPSGLSGSAAFMEMKTVWHPIGV
jgi:hypothetical protein